MRYIDHFFTGLVIAVGAAIGVYAVYYVATTKIMVVTLPKMF